MPPIAAGDEAVSSPAGLNFTGLFQQYYARIYNYLRYRTSSLEDAEDLLSITFEKAYTHRGQFNPRKGAFSTWLFRIAHNTLANYYRTRQRRAAWEMAAEPPEDLVFPEASPEARAIHQEDLVHLWQNLARLGDRDREIISLKFGAQLSNQEIGKIMAMSEKNVSVALLRAMRRLQKQMQETAE